MENQTQLYRRVNDKYLSQFNNQYVTLVGKYEGLQNNQIQLKLNEEGNAKLIIQTGFQSNTVSPGDYLEVRCLVQSNRLMYQEHTNHNQDFDLPLYNKLIDLMMLPQISDIFEPVH